MGEQAKVTPDERKIMNLLLRSERDDGGWAKVSRIVWPLVAAVRPELIEREGETGVGGRCRFTPLGQTITDWT